MYAVAFWTDEHSGSSKWRRRSEAAFVSQNRDSAISSTEIEYFLDQIVYDAKMTIRTIHSRNQHRLPKKWPLWTPI